MKLAVFPKTNANPYLDLFHGAMAQQGIRADGYVEFSAQWEQERAAQYDAIHLHWGLERIWRTHVPQFKGHWRLQQLGWLLKGPDFDIWDKLFTSAIRGRLGVRRVGRFLRGVRQRGVRIIWTLHDLDPPETLPGVDQRGHLVVAQHSDLIICHSEKTREEALQRYRPRCDIVVMPHGNYDGVYPSPRPREQVLAEVGLDPSRPVLCCLGRMRDYKGLDIACEAVSHCDEVQLLIAGTVQRGFDLPGLQQRVQRLGRAVLIPRTITDQEFADFAAASEAVLLPYRMITGSGALWAAWTLSRSVIASDLGYFKEMLPANCPAGALFRSEDPIALAAAIKQHLALPSMQRAAAARKMADRHCWEQCVLPVVDVLERWKSAARSDSTKCAPPVRETASNGIVV